MIVSLIAAMDRNRLIGAENQLPWHLPVDFAHFKRVTMGKPIVMGRLTYDSIGKPLPGRKNIVLTRDASKRIDGVTCITCVDQLDAIIDDEEVMVIGGSQLYTMMLPRADRLYITRVDGSYEGDAWFPAFDDEDWEVIERRLSEADENNAVDCEFITYERRGPE